MKTKTRFHKLTAWLLTLAMLMTFIPSFTLSVNAATASGTTGDCTWSFDDSTGILTVSGTGAMANYNLTNQQAPWNDYESSLKKVVIESGVTTVGNNAFNGCSVLAELELPDTLTKIGNNTFKNCTNLSYVEYWGTTEPTIGSGTFSGCDNLLVVNVPTNYEGNSFATVFGVSKTLVAETTPTAYTVTVATSENGTVEADVSEAAEGDTVTLTVTPASGYELDTLTVKDADDNGVTVTDNKFTMPDGNVTVTATFKAVETAIKKNITLGTSALKGGQASNVYLGTYQQSSLGNRLPEGTEGVDWIRSTTADNNGQGPYYSIEPIKWRVLSDADGKALLLSDKNLDVVRYLGSNKSVTWETSSIRSWLNGYGAKSNLNNIDYSSDNFINDSFRTAEKAVITDTTVVNDDNPSSNIDGGNNTTDKVFLLSIAEANDTSYFTDNNSRMAVNTAYVHGGGKNGIDNMKGVGEADRWWLRSPGEYDTYAASVAYDGSVNNYGAYATHYYYAVRPAFNLNLSSVLFTSAAVNGKPETFGEVKAYSGNEYKLTVVDESRNGFTAELIKSTDKYGISYSNATTGYNEYISAIVKDTDGDITHYGRIAKVTDESGICEIDLSGVDLTNSTLYIFNEQYNGDYKTDFASELKKVTIPENANAYSITATLTNAKTNNNLAIRLMADTTDYTARLTEDEGYYLPKSITIKVGDSELSDADYSYDCDSGALTIPSSKITGDIEIICSAIYIEKVTFTVSGDKQIYESGTARTVTITPIYTENSSGSLSTDAFEVMYYEVDENNGVLKSVEAVTSAIAPGKYLYVIDFVQAQRYYTIENEYTVFDTTLPDISAYDNIGYMLIKSGITGQQTPIYFKDGTVNLKVGGTYTNELTDENTENTVTYKSSNESIVTVDETTGEIKAVGKGTATITATSTKDETTPVYASYTINVGLATVTLTADSFNVTAQDKVYDRTDEVKISAVLKDGVAYEGDNIKVDITGYFADVNAADNKTVSYKITGISGTGAENYVLENGIIENTTTANITKATVTIICATTTTRTFDGTPQSVDVSAMANGAVFDSSNYTVKYNGDDAPTAVGSYPVTVELTEEAAKNYTVTQPSATLIIKDATQEVFSIEGVPEAVYYGDSFTLSADGASGTVTYEITSRKEIANVDGDKVTVNGVGKVTITATSVKDGHTNRVATKTFNAKQKVLTPTATATDRTYNGENGVEVTISLENIVNSDSITATGTGTMLNADAGKSKIVYVSGITLDGDKKDLYTLDTSSVQTTVNIAKKEITAITVSASDKKYDENENATATVKTIAGVIEADAGQVEVIGSAVFADANSEENKTVTFTASSLAGAKAANYYIDGTLTAETTATINPVTVNFVVGQTSFVYDGNDKKITLSASDEFGRIFNEYTVEYSKTPNEAGTYTATVLLDDSVNYTTTQGEITVTISEATQDNLVIIGLPGTIQYGDSFELEAVGGEDGGTYEWTVKDGADVTLSATDTATTTVTIGDVVGEKVEIEVVKKTDNYEDISAKVVFVPTQKAVTFDITNLEQTYDGNAKEVDVNTETGVTYDVKYNNSADLPLDAGTYTVKVTANGNYSGMQTTILTIKKATATGKITGINDSYTYGDTITGVDVTDLKADTNAKITYAGTGIYVPQDTPPTKVGNYTVIAEITGDNYETLTVTENFVIEKATLTVKAENATRAYGEANPIFTLSYTGFENGETKDVLLADPIATVNANASSGVGEYNITVSGGSAENYKFIYDNTGKLTVTGATGGSLYITGSTNTAYVNDVFVLHAFYGNSKVNVTWASSDSTIAEIATNGTVTAKSAGTVTITATADANYGNATATFELNVKQTGITLVPTGLVKTYTGERQDISFADNADFTPVLSGEGKNVDVTYTLISNPSVTEPIQAGTYSVVYTISDGSYTGGGNTTMYINKATVTAKVTNGSKVYGDEYSAYDLEIKDYGTLAESVKTSTLDEIKALTTYASDGAAKTAIVKDGGYEITPTLSKSETDNIIFTVEKGTLTVTKAPLTVKVKDVSREYGAENPTLEVEYTGFKNEETENTENILTGELVLTYDESITAETAVGEYADKTTASGIDSANYDITFDNGNVTITKIGVTASAGTSRSSYLTVKFDKAVEGVTFTVTDGTNPVEITEVTASSDNKTYTLKGSFSTSVTYTVTPTLTSETHEITSEALSIKPSSSGGGGGGGGGSSAPTTYTVKFETNGGNEIESIKVTKNKTVDKPTAPTKDGYTFMGWYTDKELTKAYDFDTKVTKAITLYAKWEKHDDENIDDKTDDKTDTPVWENPFTDVNADDWYYENVEYAVENGLFNGTSATTFAPNGIITRAMMVTVLYRAEGEPAVNKSIPFADIDMSAYYANAVIWAQQNGIVKGVSETEFVPNDNITREQIAAIMFRYAQYKGMDAVTLEENLHFEDANEISEYAVSALNWAVGIGLMKGKSTTTINPKDNATRAEIAAILHRFIEVNN